MFGGFFGALGGGFYDQNFRAYPVAFIEKEGAEAGDKVILPPSSLNTLASMQVEYPMLFKVENKRGQRVSHCGVLEFIAQEGMLYMPQWMMDNLLLSVGDLVNLKNVSLPKGSFIKIQPHTSDFLDIANPKAVLETSLRSFTCLTQGDTIVIQYNGRKYYIDIVEVKPDQAVSVVETDVEVDFAPPKDYKEPDYKALAAASSSKPPSASAGHSLPGVPPKDSSAATPDPESEEPKFAAFSGKGNRLDGRASSVAPVDKAGGAQPSTSAPQAGNGTLRSGTVVFGNPGGAPESKPSIPGNRLAARLAQSSSNGAPKPQETSKEEQQEEPKFVAFRGSGRSLKD